MLFTVLSGLITSSLLIPFGKFFRSKWSAVLAILPIVLFLFFASYIPAVNNGQIFYEHVNWVPSLKINFDFRLDGLSCYLAS